MRTRTAFAVSWSRCASATLCLLTSSLLLQACGSSGASEESAQPVAEAATRAAASPETDGVDDDGPDAYPDEACMRGVLISYRGAEGAPQGVTRAKADASERAHDLRERVAGGEDIAAVAREEGDGTRAARGGQLGTFPRSAWPEPYEALMNPAFALEVGQLSDIIEAPYGYIFFERCPVEKVHTRHILLRYQGAHNAPADLTRTKAQARTEAQALRARVAAPGADFAALAREHSEDGSADQGGDIGLIARGLLEPAYENAAFALAPGQIAEVVETRVGFHVIQRVRDDG